jgi:hypothetical protein
LWPGFHLAKSLAAIVRLHYRDQSDIVAPELAWQAEAPDLQGRSVSRTDIANQMTTQARP